MGGYPLNLVAGRPVNEELICKACKQILRDPVMAECSEGVHMLCTSCLLRTESPNHYLCPVDNNLIWGKHYIKKASCAFMSLLKDLQFHCKFHMAGCKETRAMGQMGNHIGVCKFNPDNENRCKCGSSLCEQGEDALNSQCVTYLNKAYKRKVEDLEEQMEKNSKMSKKVKRLEAEVESLSAVKWAICLADTEVTNKSLQLRIKLGDIVRIVAQPTVHFRFYLAEVNSKRGLVPMNKLRVISAAAVEETWKGQENAECTATYTASSENGHELSYTTSDRVQIILKDCAGPLGGSDKKYVMASVNGKIGYVDPANIKISEEQEIGEKVEDDSAGLDDLDPIVEEGEEPVFYYEY